MARGVLEGRRGRVVDRWLRALGVGRRRRLDLHRSRPRGEQGGNGCGGHQPGSTADHVFLWRAAGRQASADPLPRRARGVLQQGARRRGLATWSTKPFDDSRRGREATWRYLRRMHAADAIPVVNAGSSSLKFEVFLLDGDDLASCRGRCRRGAERPPAVRGD